MDDFLDLSGISRDDITYKASHFWRYAKPERDDIQNEGFYLSPSNKLAFIGDYLMGGRVEGAFLSGRNLATSINRLEKSRRPYQTPGRNRPCLNSQYRDSRQRLPRHHS